MARHTKTGKQAGTDGVRRPAVPPNKRHRDRKNDYRRQPKHRDRDSEADKGEKAAMAKMAL